MSIEDKLKEIGLPDTREGFLQLNYLGDVPDHIDPEIEESFPEKYRLKKNDSNADDETTGDVSPESGERSKGQSAGS